MDRENTIQEIAKLLRIAHCKDVSICTQTIYRDITGDTEYCCMVGWLNMRKTMTGIDELLRDVHCTHQASSERNIAARSSVSEWKAIKQAYAQIKRMCNSKGESQCSQ